MKQPELWDNLKQYKGKINKYIAVSKDAAEAFTQRTGIEYLMLIEKCLL